MHRRLTPALLAGLVTLTGIIAAHSSPRPFRAASSAAGTARLSHDFPDGPQITSPADGSTVPAGSFVARWNPVPEPAGINVVGYRAIVEREDPLRVFSVDLPASVTSVTVPQEFVEAGTRYKLEVQAIEAGGNQTITEIEFSVS